jgi:hypothetical protein
MQAWGMLKLLDQRYGMRRTMMELRQAGRIISE